MATGETQARILDTAITLFNENGVKAISVNRIAEAAGVSRGNLHYHFPTKETLVAAIFDRMAREMEEAGARDLETPTLAHLRIMFERYAGQVWQYRFLFRELTALILRDSVLRRRYHAHRQRRLAELEQFFEELISHGLMARPDPPVTVNGLVTLSWIVCDNWLAFLEAGGEAITSHRIDDGFALVLSLFQPHLKTGDDGHS
ncbi:MAG: TetR/AcrR family transcriptional regulator [Alphaproteobacteria bacterium]|nr:MAG: TetR/AcrR family transcriptional regulator [Alphaproteobacteria bacterium]